MFDRTPMIESMTSRILVKNAGTVQVRGQTVVLTTDRMSAVIPWTGRKSEWMTGKSGARIPASTVKSLGYEVNDEMKYSF